MKKIIYCLGFIAATLLLFSCKSSEEVAAAKKAEEEKRIAEEQAEEAKVRAERNFLGWVGGVVKNPVVEDGIIKIKTNSDLGTFCIYVVDPEERNYSIFSTLNEFSSTGFHLKAGRKVYKLIADKNIKVSAGETDSGVSLLYRVKDVADVCVRMDVFQSILNKPTDTVKFRISIKNTGKKTESYTLKAILDTILGEKSSYHFYSNEDAPIRGEVGSRKMENDKWFVSKNDRASMQLLVDGGDTTKTDLVSLANYSTLENAEWEPSVQAYRAFDTLLSYNNSAMAVFWPTVRLAPGESSDIIFYISVALDGLTPNGYKYVYGIQAEEKPVEVEEEIINLPPTNNFVVEEKKVEKSEEKEPVIEVFPVVGKPYVEDFIKDPDTGRKTGIASPDKVAGMVDPKDIIKIKEKTNKQEDDADLVVVEENITEEEITAEEIKAEEIPEVVEITDEEPAVVETYVDVTEPVKETVEEPVEIEVVEDAELPNVEFNVDTIAKDHLTPEYVQGLIDRINELDESENPDRNEILLLGKELDAILSILGQE